MPSGPAGSLPHSYSTTVSDSLSEADYQPPPPTQSAAHGIYDALREKLALELAVAEGAENLLDVFQAEKDNAPELDDDESEGGAEERDALRAQVEQELRAARGRIDELLARIRTLEAQMYGPGAANGGTHGPVTSMTGLQSPVSMWSEDQYPFQRSAAPSPRIPPEVEEPDDFGSTFEEVVNLLQQLEECDDMSGDPLSKLKTMDSAVAALVRQPRVRFELQLQDVLPRIVHLLAETQGKDVRAGSYRLIRHLVVDQDDIVHLHSARIDLYLMRSLSRDHKADLEKEHALRLIRTLLALPDTYSEEGGDGDDGEHVVRPVSVAVMRAVVSIAENQEEKLRLASLETLGELALRDMSLLVQSDGLRVVLQTLSDGPYDIAPSLARCFTAVIDWPESRQWLRHGVDLEIVLAGLTQINQKGTAQVERVSASAKITTELLKSWAGIMYLNMNDKQAIRAIVESLTNPQLVIRNAIIEMFFDIFGARAGVKHDYGHPGTRMSALQSKTPQSAREGYAVNMVPNRDKTNLIDQHLALLLMVFLDAGLVEALASIASTQQEKTSSDRVALLMSKILQLANRILPVQYAAHAQSLPRLFALTTSFDTSEARVAASTALVAIDTFNRDQSKLQADATNEDNRPRSNSVEDPLRRGQRQVETTKIAMAMQIDDVTFRNSLLETQVLSTKDHTKWNYDMILELLEGPLLNPKRLDESMRATKFMRRLLGFYHPFACRFSDIRKSRSNSKWTLLGCTTLTTLIANPDGVRYLSEDKLLRQLGDCLVQLDPSSGTPPSEVLLSKHRVDVTMVGGYFTMIGALTKHPEGVKLLDQFKIFTACYRVSELRSREDLIRTMLVELDYSSDGHARVLLCKALTSSYRHIRVFATQHLGTLLNRDIAASPAAQEWQIRLLLTQIYDPSPEVCELAVQVLESACQNIDTLQIVVQMRPSLDHLGDVGAGLLTRFLSTSVGVRYLHEIGFTERELEDWYNERNATYVVQVELQLASALGTDRHSLEKSRYDGTPPPHFYGELVKTEEGCEILEDSGHFPGFAEAIRQHAYEAHDSDTIAYLKSALWAVGHIGSTAGGLDFLDREYLIENIVDIAEESEVFSLRGTAFFVLGLIASTVEGIEMLEDYNWQGVTTPLGTATGICVPMDLRTFVETDMWTTPAVPIPASVSFPATTNHLETTLLSALANLSNHILAAQASKTLARLKQRHAALFSDVNLWYRAWEMLGSYHYRNSVRRYILELFDLQLMPETVKLLDQAGRQLKAAARAQRTGEAAETKKDKLTLGLDRRVKVLIDGAEGVSSDEEDEEDRDSSSDDEEGKTGIPLKVLQPVLAVRGFLL